MNERVESLLREMGVDRQKPDLEQISARAARIERRTRLKYASSLAAIALLLIGGLVAINASRERGVVADVQPELTTSAEDSAGAAQQPTSAPPESAVTSQTPASPPCEQPVRVIIDRLNAMRISGETSGECVGALSDFADTTSAQPPCWARCDNGLVVTAIQVQNVESFQGEESEFYQARLVVTYRNDGGSEERSVELLDLTSSGGTIEATGLWRSPDDLLAARAPEAVIEFYSLLATANYVEAASMLAVGGQDLRDREDLAPLGAIETLEDLSVLLANWCQTSRCGPVAIEGVLPGDGARVVVEVAPAQSESGGLVWTHSVILVEGEIGLMGLPPAQ